MDESERRRKRIGGKRALWTAVRYSFTVAWSGVVVGVEEALQLGVDGFFCLSPQKVRAAAWKSLKSVGLKIDVYEAGLMLSAGAPRLGYRRKMAEEDISTEVGWRKWLFYDDFQTGWFQRFSNRRWQKV
jgi:hypothetical protein